MKWCLAECISLRIEVFVKTIGPHSKYKNLGNGEMLLKLEFGFKQISTSDVNYGENKFLYGKSIP